MAVSSPLNPSTIVKERSGRASSSSAQNFITGGSPLGSGVVSSAANKIVGFSRGGAAGVAAKPPDLQSIISTLSSNILNNVENRVTSINNNVTQVVQGKLQELESEHKSRLAQIESAKPNAILNNFLTLYKEAIGYIQFLGNRNNVKTLGDNLKGLQNVFAEAFNVARVIRETIKRTVGQLSSLPKASTGGGGLSLDIGIPGPGLRMGSMGKLARAVKKGRMPLMLGGAALAGGLGSKVVSGMMDIGGDNVQGVGMAEGAIPGALLDRFSGILDRFDSAIKALTQNGKQTGASSTGASVSMEASDDGGGGGGGGGDGGGGNTNSGSPADVSGNYTAAEKALIATVTQSEGTAGDKGYNTVYGGAVVPQLTEMTLGELYEASRQGGTDRLPARLGGGVIPYAKDGYNSTASGAPQLMPGTLKGLIDSGKFSADQKFSKEVQNAIIIELARRRMGGGPITAENVRKFQKELSMEWASMGTYHGQTTKTSGEAVNLFEKNLRYFEGQGSTTVAAKANTPTVTPAPGQAVNNKNVAQTVAQPPPAPQTTVTVAPVNVASPQTQSGGGQQKTIPPTQKMTGGGSVPFLRSSNDDNFLTIYSKMVYNVVDG